MVPLPGEGSGPPNAANPTQSTQQSGGLLGGLAQVGNAAKGIGAIGGLFGLAEGGRIDPSSAMQGFAYGGMPGGFPQGGMNQPMQGFGGLPGFAGGRPMMQGSAMPMRAPMGMQRPQMASPPMQAAPMQSAPMAPAGNAVPQSGLASAAPVVNAMPAGGVAPAAAPVAAPASVGNQMPVNARRGGGIGFADGGDSDVADVSGSGDDWIDRYRRLALAPNTSSSSGPSSLFSKTQDKYGLPPGYLATTANIESGGNPNSHNEFSGADGLFQSF